MERNSSCGGVVVKTSCWVLKEQPWPPVRGSPCGGCPGRGWLLFLAGAIFYQTVLCVAAPWVWLCVMQVVGVGGGWRVV